MSISQTTQVLSADLANFHAKYPDVEIIDELDSLLVELCRIENASLAVGGDDFQKHLQQLLKRYQNSEPSRQPIGEWHYYPWLNRIVRLLDRDDHRLIRSSRNRDLISIEEQQGLERSRIGIAGLSVGSQVLRGLALTSSWGELRIADYDTVELSNLQRLGVGNGVADLGLPKCVIAKRTMAELDPWTPVTSFDDGLRESNLDTFVTGLDVVVCAMDDLQLKLRLRQVAKRHHVPVVMATDTDNVFIDVEPHHLNAGWEPFHGWLAADDIVALETASPEDKQTFVRLAMKIIGMDHHSAELMASLPQIGQTLVSQPQLGTAAMLSGAAAARTVIRLLTGKPVPSGRTVLGIETLLSRAT